MSDDGLDRGLEDHRPERFADGGPLGQLPRLRRRQIRLDRQLGPEGPDLMAWLGDWQHDFGCPLVADRFEISWRAAGLRRPGVVIHLTWPSLRTRVACGIDPPLAHALVDRLLGFERTAAEAKLQVSPVEWGVLSFLAAAALQRLAATSPPLGNWDVTIDRVGPDPFDIAGLGPIVTWRWRIQIGETTGSARLWIPESLLNLYLVTDADATSRKPPSDSSVMLRANGWSSRFADLISEWRVEVGAVTIAAAALANSLQPGHLLLIDDGPLSGTVASPAGIVELVQLGEATRRSYQATIEPDSAGARLILTSPLRTQASFRNPVMNDPEILRGTDPHSDGQPPEHSTAAPIESTSLTVTLTVELGRVNIPLARLAELKPGDVVELARHAREPVDLSSNGRLVARGELVQVDTELGVRIIQVYL